MSQSKYKVLILGAGSGGISMAARLKKHLPAHQIAIVEPSEVHYYQPLWTIVGSGIVKKEVTRKAMATLIPKSVDWIQDRVAAVLPTENKVKLAQGKELSYEVLIVATGLQLDFNKIKGVEGNLGKNGLCTIYQYDQVDYVSKCLNDFKGGRAIFTMPPVPIKCAGAPQKIMYLADEIFRKNGVREKSEVIFTTAGKVIFGVPDFAKALLEVVKKKNIAVKYTTKLVEVEAQTKKAHFDVTIETQDNGQVKTEVKREIMPYDILHVVPPMSAHSYVRESGLAFTEGPQLGWLKVQQNTLQHMDYKNVFGIGDVTGVPNSKTGAAIRKQAPVLEKNILQFMHQQALTAQYDGYSSCPLVTGFGKVVLAEFGYDSKLMPSFPFDQTKERRSMWHLKKDLLPKMYWHGMLKGRM